MYYEKGYYYQHIQATMVISCLQIKEGNKSWNLKIPRKQQIGKGFQIIAFLYTILLINLMNYIKCLSYYCNKLWNKHIKLETHKIINYIKKTTIKAYT